jgi:hypothetical protein
MQDIRCPTCDDLRVAVMNAMRQHMECIARFSNGTITGIGDIGSLEGALEISRETESKIVLAYQAHLLAHDASADPVFS